MATKITSTGLTFDSTGSPTQMSRKPGYHSSSVGILSGDMFGTFTNAFTSSSTVDVMEKIYISVLGLELNGTSRITFNLIYGASSVFYGTPGHTYIGGTYTASSHGSNEGGSVDALSYVYLTRAGATSATSGQYRYNGIIELTLVDKVNNGYSVSWHLGSMGTSFTQVYGTGYINLGSANGRATGFRIGNDDATSPFDTFRSASFSVIVL